MRRVVIALIVLLLAAAPIDAEPQVETLVTGLEAPWALAFAPDGRLFVTERPGRLRVVQKGRLAPEPVATLNVAHDIEAGLLGLALDPQFADNGHAYVCYTRVVYVNYTIRHALRRLHVLGMNDWLVNRISRLTIRGHRTVEELVLLDGIPGSLHHIGCRLKFGPDGKLYATMGDARRRALAQQRDSLVGKILRLNADGTVPEDNPFPGSFVYSYGHRNPQGIAWDRFGRLLASEHGPVGHDEINHIRAGRNYGWPVVQGRADDARFEEPLIESGAQTWAPSGVAVLGNDLFVAALRGQRLLRITFDQDGKVVKVGVLLDVTHGRLRDVIVGPDGALYITTNNSDGRGMPKPGDDRVLRVVP